MNQIQNWLQGNCDPKLLVKRRRIKGAKCDRTSFQNGFWRILAMIIGQPKLILCSFIFFSSAPAYSQINPDNTLGAESSRITPNVLINGANADKIDGGAVRGSNLFHSFSEFNINDGQRVYFGNPAGVQNILTRVTGGQASNILGTLGVDGIANLFLINPNGILFGQNARLDVRGSFVGTTANAVQFGNQGIFSATNPEAPPLLTVNPSALLFNQINPKPITNQSQAAAGISPAGENVTGLRVADNQNLLLIGGNINIDGGGLRAYGGNIELAAMNAPATVGLNIAANNLPSLAIPDSVERADVSLSNGAEVNVRGADGGNIKINGRNVNLTGDSKLRAGIEIGLGTANSQSGDVVINATGTTNVTEKSIISNSVRERAFGKSGDVNITTGLLTLDKEAIINVSTIGQGDAGNIFIQASDAVTLGSDTAIYSSVASGGVGNAGSVHIKANSLTLSDGATLSTDVSGVSQEFPVGRGNGGNININVASLFLNNGELSASTYGQGNAGNILIQAKDSVLLKNATGIYSSVETGAVGNGGSIDIQAGSLSIIEGSEINTRTLGEGNGGKITINARDTISLDGFGNDSNIFSRIISAVNPSGVGNARDIQLTTGSLSMTSGALISASTSGRGNAGNIIIDAFDTISFDTNARVMSNVFTDAVGNGADVRVKTGSLLFTNGSNISTNVLGQGNAGNITVEARDTVKLDGVTTREVNGNVFDSTSGLSSSLLTGGVGKAGDISVTTGSLFVTNGADISSSTSGQGNAGNITINARDTVTFAGFAGETSIYSQASSNVDLRGIGNGGDIRISANTQLFQNGGTLQAFNGGEGNGGNIFLEAKNSITFDGFDGNGLNSAAVTYAYNGDAGGIQVKTGALFLTNGGRMSTSILGKGQAGNITIEASDTVEVNGFISNVTLPSGTVVDIGSGLQSNLFSGEGKGGEIQITTGSLAVTNGGQISSNTGGKGDAGDITINARDTVTFDGVSRNGFMSNAGSVVLSDAIGNGGNIQVNAKALLLNNGGQIDTFSAGQGNAGSIFINTLDRVVIDNGSSLNSYATESGNGGKIQVNTGTFSLTNGGTFLTAALRNAGNITINAHDAVIVDGVDRDGFSSSLLSILFDGGIGKAGDIEVTTNSLTARNGGIMIASSVGNGNAGNITINAVDSITFEGVGSNGLPSGVYTTLENQGEGKGGEINLTTGSLSVFGGAISSTTSAKGDAGNITIKARDTIILDGAGRGNILNLENIERRSSLSGIFSAVGIGATGNAGNIDIKAGNVRISNKAGITAATLAGNGGNITLDIRDFLLLRSGGFVTTTAGVQQAGGDGGNITINSPFIVALPNENSDISANAFSGKGGNVNINVQNIFGTEARPQQTNQSDITASSELGVQGQITISQPDIQPPQKLLELPTGLIDATTQFAQICPRDYNAKPLGSFVVTGRGSLPPNVLQPLALTTSLSPLASLDGENADIKLQRIVETDAEKRVKEDGGNSSQIVEAQGLVKTSDGNIMLVAEAPTATPAATSSSAMCPKS
ncbi:filamentous hemagglutinin N-terminal domain-containing protein [Tolypothrix sp. LEGE 11397]|uniref:beta strand repeat-containing protein n=1 Tax=Tolypothrix sp. PCC 7601 TaxID=1188 RepID=UPI0005EAC5D2|nr:MULTISPECIES: filamentous hemagglutinin N-terminal domain-containing protein [unclassified Tolypothrix]BAY91014.1 filamentous hemagglutinin outer membrane protein [Microchaete diplosiphon NIES-3275]EKE99727.1 protein, filamentous hemagglutinin family [Tolypothrix sp. PCC 7601]MBE9081624.1 filamentous hemagglutinin N-terminal domain-containing protein [Tolypothrix sp. LEGE 11397]UYD25118.1 filamentous hemagglutinin N-terminal domain-containing protein [Tolypothrix sp. PCC 7712]UYD32643.1 fil